MHNTHMHTHAHTHRDTHRHRHTHRHTHTELFPRNRGSVRTLLKGNYGKYATIKGQRSIRAKAG